MAELLAKRGGQVAPDRATAAALLSLCRLPAQLPALKVRKTPSWLRSWASFSLF